MTFRLMFLLLLVWRLALPPVRAEEPITLWERAADGAEFYVAPSGNDQHPGSLEQPFRTLSRARDAVRAINQQDRQPGPIVVMLRGGTYQPDLSVVFSDRDSGSAESPIVYMAYPGERPVLSGGRAAADWQPHEGRILVAELPQQENQYYRFRTLFLDGQRQIRARHPNFDPAHPWDGGWAFIAETLPVDSTTPATLRWEPGVFSGAWANPQHGELFTVPGLAWINDFMPIAVTDRQSRTITVTRTHVPPWSRLKKGNRFRVENLLEHLDQPGEWCFNPDARRLYFWPPGAGVPAGQSVTFPVLDRLIEVRSTSGQPVRHIHFQGLTFTQTLTVYPNPIAKHPGYIDCNRPNSAGYAFLMENAEHCRVQGCRFDQVGGDAIRLHGYNAYHQIVQNEIVGAGAQAICLADLDFWPYDFKPVWRGNDARFRAMSSRLPWAIGNVISDNHIHHCGLTDGFGAAIHFHGMNCRDNVISHNLIHDQPHHAMYFSMGFGRNYIEYNDVHTLCLVMADAGGVYHNRWCILPEDPVLNRHSVVRYNRIRDVYGVAPYGREVDDPAGTPSHERLEKPHFTWGIYYDNSPRRAQVYGNLTINNVWGGVFLGGGYSQPEDCLVENNIMVESSTYQFDAAVAAGAAGNRWRRNIVYYKSPNAALLRARDTNGIAECDYNVYFPASGQPLKLVGVPGESWQRWREMGFDQHSVVADPLFVDPAQGDYRLRAGSPALQLGFEQLPFDRMGPRTPAGPRP